MSIGNNIYALRKAKKVTQAQLAEKIGVSEQAVSKWENDICAPDVSLFPVIAEYFGVSIDRLFGYHNNSYAEEVKKIIQAADDSMDTYKEIEIIREGLSRYPNSPELKIYLAFSLSMVNRFSEDADERAKAVEKAIKVCTEVVDTCGDQEQVDDALNMLTRIYNETAQYEKAQACIEKMSAECYDRRVLGMVGMLGGKKSYAEQEQYAQYALWKMYWTMSHVLEKMSYTYTEQGQTDKALAFIKANQALLSTFDLGCPNFYAAYKITAYSNEAKAYMKLGNKQKCLAALKQFFVVASQVNEVAKSEDFHVCARNPLYFSAILDRDLMEECILPGVHPEKFFPTFDAFFGEDEEYAAFKQAVLA